MSCARPDYDSPNVSRILNKMVEKGLVHKERQSDDQRIVYVSLTEKGRQLHHQADEKNLGPQCPTIAQGVQTVNRAAHENLRSNFLANVFQGYFFLGKEKGGGKANRRREAIRVKIEYTTQET